MTYFIASRSSIQALFCTNTFLWLKFKQLLLFLKGSPLFETIFVFENYPGVSEVPDEDHGERLDLSIVQSFEKTNYALSVTVVIDPVSQSLVLGFIYDTGKYSDVRVVRSLLHQFKLAIWNLAEARENAVVADLIIEDVVDSRLGISVPAGVEPEPDFELFGSILSSAQSHPHSIALIMDDVQLSYHELLKVEPTILPAPCQLLRFFLAMLLVSALPALPSW